MLDGLRQEKVADPGTVKTEPQPRGGGGNITGRRRGQPIYEMTGTSKNWLVMSVESVPRPSSWKVMVKKLFSPAAEGRSGGGGRSGSNVRIEKRSELT